MKIDNTKLSDAKLLEIQSFLVNRFTYLYTLRQEIDQALEEEINIYNNIDEKVDSKEDWEEKYKVPYTYAVVQTMVARLIGSLFQKDNYVRLFVEKESFAEFESDLTKWVQEECDKIKLKSRARDFIEDGLVQRTSWLQLRPEVEGGKLKRLDFIILKFMDVWFDTMATDVEDTDMFVRKKAKLYKIKYNDKVYFNLDKLASTTPPDDIKKRQEYKAKQGVNYYDPQKNNVTDEVELLEYYGTYDMSEDPEKPDFKDVIFTLANRQLLIRMETVDLATKKKKLIFPIRPMRQANSLIGKGLPQITKDMQYELNDYRSLRATNAKLQAKLLFKYRKNSGVDFDELFGMGGNSIGWEDDPRDIDIFPIPNLINALSFVSSDIVNDIQMTTGAADYVMGTSAGRGITETASGIRTVTEQAMFKFEMMSGNIYDDLCNFINFIIVLWYKYGQDDVVMRYPSLKQFFELSTETILEDTTMFDISLTELAARRDVERSQWINAMGVILPLAQQLGLNMEVLMKQFFDRVGMENSNLLFTKPAGAGATPEAMLAMMQQAQGASGAPAGSPGGPGSPQKPSQATPEELALNQNTPR